ncbi:related to epoxide hydrolase [Fusarium oxysporum]|uniref:Related to epoxide hydrolase n=1 Tax=Fusarium oxysporum TaxID=5507 RepID=A0A2H3SWL2_FUSOX|nr:related to epoxide hydrolase [Fusarium oxysporum]
MKFLHLLSALVALASAKPSFTKGRNLNFPADTTKLVKWNIEVNPEFIEKLERKAKLFEPASEFEDKSSNANWEEGLPRSVSKALRDFWVNDYDWFKYQKEINANYSHYALSVKAGEGYEPHVPLHFVHERSQRKDAIPLLLIHGYPSTHLEWSKVIKPLTSPKSRKDPAFHVISVDLPGYGFSPAPVLPTLGPKQLAIAFDNLMKDIGYPKYAVMSQDQGWWPGMWMTYLIPDNIIGHYCDFAAISPNATDLERYARGEATEDEARYIEAGQAWSQNHTSYSQLFVQSPRIAGELFADSPVGFAGYLWYLMRKVNGGYEITPEWVISRTIPMMIQEAWTSADSNAFPYTQVPTGVSRWSWAGNPFPEIDNNPMVPKNFLERHVNLVHFTTYDKGGHFPAEARPDAWLNDIRQFFSKL